MSFLRPTLLISGKLRETNSLPLLQQHSSTMKVWLLNWPVYSPDSSPFENVWSIIIPTNYDKGDPNCLITASNKNGHSLLKLHNVKSIFKRKGDAREWWKWSCPSLFTYVADIKFQMRLLFSNTIKLLSFTIWYGVSVLLSFRHGVLVISRLGKWSKRVQNFLDN